MAARFGKLIGRRGAATLGLLLLGACTTRPPPVEMAPPAPVPAAVEPLADATVADDIGALAAASLSRHRLPGLALVVLHADEILVAAGYGHIALDLEPEVTVTTVFQLGAISKQFLAALVLRLAELGRLSLDDPVTGYLPDFAHLPDTMTIRHLLNHSSGLRELFMLPEATEGYSDLSLGVDELRAAVRRAPVDFAPGTRWSYSNTGYALLAFIVESVTSLPYHEALDLYLFSPLALGSLRHCAAVPAGPGEARGHMLDGEDVARSPPENLNWAWGDSGLCGSAYDLARWTRLLHTGQVIGEDAWREMTAATRLAGGEQADYGFALALVDLDGVARLAHNGAMFGFAATAAYYPGTEHTVVVLANRGDVRTEAIERDIARRLLHLPLPEYEIRELPLEELMMFVGRYDIGVFEVEVLLAAEGLRLEMQPPGPRTLLHCVGGREFIGDAGPDANRVLFTPDEGRAEGLRLTMGGMYWYGVRID